MGQAIAEVLPLAIGVAISPVPIIAVILVLFSARAQSNGPAFLVGWVLGVAVVSTAVYMGLVVFVVLASASIAVPVAFYLAGGDRAAQVLDGWKAWLSAHNEAVMALLFLVFGVVLFSQGLRGLTA